MDPPARLAGGRRRGRQRWCGARRAAGPVLWDARPAGARRRAAARPPARRATTWSTPTAGSARRSPTRCERSACATWRWSGVRRPGRPGRTPAPRRTPASAASPPTRCSAGGRKVVGLSQARRRPGTLLQAGIPLRLDAAPAGAPDGPRRRLRAGARAPTAAGVDELAPGVTAGDLVTAVDAEVGRGWASPWRRRAETATSAPPSRRSRPSPWADPGQGLGSAGGARPARRGGERSGGGGAAAAARGHRPAGGDARGGRRRGGRSARADPRGPPAPLGRRAGQTRPGRGRRPRRPPRPSRAPGRSRSRRSATPSWAACPTACPPTAAARFFSQVDDLLTGDVVLGNLEGTLATGGSSKCGSGSSELLRLPHAPVVRAVAEGGRLHGHDASPTTTPTTSAPSASARPSPR